VSSLTLEILRVSAAASDPMSLDHLTSYSPENPILLVTDFAPDAGGGGAVILRSLLDQSNRRRLIWASPLMGDTRSSTSGDDVALLAASYHFSTLLRRRSVTVDSLLAGALADEIAGLALRRNARALWIVMHGAMVHVAARLLGRAGTLPVHLSVHDDPPFGVSMLSRRHVALVPLVARDLRYALVRAWSVDVISQRMADRYRSLYGIDANVIHRGIAGPVNVSPHHHLAAGLDIGVLGNTYGYKQLLVLARALEYAAERAAVPARLVVVGAGHGARLQADLNGRIQVEVTGHLDESAAVERLSRCFLLYLNYPFSRRAAVLRNTSFPTKLSTYLLAARPLLVHSPRDSSIASLFSIRDYVVPWSSARPEDGATAILSGWLTEGMHGSKHVPAEQIRKQYYDLVQNRGRLFAVLNALVRPPPG
jgi:hypothetical protein